MPSLALIFHLIDQLDRQRQRRRQTAAVLHLQNPTPRPISYEAAVMAFRWCKYLESHARRVYGLSIDPAFAAASSLAGRLEAGDIVSKFNAREIYRKGWAGLTTREYVEAAIRELLDAGWIRELPRERSNVGRPAKPSYEINPDVTTAGGNPNGQN